MSQASARWTEKPAVTTEREKSTSRFRNMEGWCWGETALMEGDRGTSWGYRQVPFQGMSRSWSLRCRAQMGSAWSSIRRRFLTWLRVEGSGRSGTPQCKKEEFKALQGLEMCNNEAVGTGWEASIKYPILLLLCWVVCVCVRVHVYKCVWHRCVILCGGPRSRTGIFLSHSPTWSF